MSEINDEKTQEKVTPEATPVDTASSTESTPANAADAEKKASPRTRWLWLIFFVALLGYSIPHLNVQLYSLKDDAPEKDPLAFVQDEKAEAEPAPAAEDSSPAATSGAEEAPETQNFTDAPAGSETPAAAEVEATIQPAPEQNDRIRALEEKLAQLSTVDPKIQEQALAATKQAEQTLTLMRGQVELLQQQLEHVKQQTQQQGLPVRQLQLWVVLNQLKTAIDRGAPTMPLVIQLREGWVESDAAELGALRKLVEASSARIPTEASLLQDFHQLRQDVSSSILHENVGVWYRLKAILREHIRIRHLNREVTEDTVATSTADPLQLLDEAELMIAAGELKGAIENLNSLPSGRTAFESWVYSATRLIEARRAIDVLERSLLNSMQSMPLRGEASFPTDIPAMDDDTPAAETSTPPATAPAEVTE
jgi:hypothetical protein